MPTQCKPIFFAFQGCQGRKVTAAFDGGSITSNAGALLLRAADRSIGLIDRVAACFTDHRDARLTEHSVRTLVADSGACRSVIPFHADHGFQSIPITPEVSG